MSERMTGRQRVLALKPRANEALVLTGSAFPEDEEPEEPNPWRLLLSALLLGIALAGIVALLVLR